MSNYQDSDSFYHDKPCKNGKPSSNNRYIYSAYGKYLAESPTSKQTMSRVEAFSKCIVSDNPLKINRLPKKDTPPLSIDEVIGLISLGYISSSDLLKSHWNFCNLLGYVPKKLTFLAAIKAVLGLFKMRNEHRNYFWENKVESVYCLAFLVMPWIRYYVKKMGNQKPTLTETVLFYIHTIFSLTKGSNSVKMLMWLMLKDMNHFLLMFADQDKYVTDYFEEGHTFKEGL